MFLVSKDFLATRSGKQKFEQSHKRKTGSQLTRPFCQHSTSSWSVFLPSRRANCWAQLVRRAPNCPRASSSWATWPENSCSERAIWLTRFSKLVWVWKTLSSHCFQSARRACISVSKSSQPLALVFCFTAGASDSTLLRRLAPISLESNSSCNGISPWQPRRLWVTWAASFQMCTEGDPVLLGSFSKCAARNRNQFIPLLLSHNSRELSLWVPRFVAKWVEEATTSWNRLKRDPEIRHCLNMWNYLVSDLNICLWCIAPVNVWILLFPKLTSRQVNEDCRRTVLCSCLYPISIFFPETVAQTTLPFH